VDGSGTSDIFYLSADGVRIYLNQSGNSLADPIFIASLPPMDSVAHVSVVDLLGQGTACLVWSSPLPGDAGRSVMYVDLMAGKKPHLLKSVVNNLGAETEITYAPSTKFYLADKAAGIPWLTRLAFPVHVVERIDRRDHISNSHLVTTYKYRHGFFDGVEREFRGFARVEQRDAEDFTVGTDDPATYQAPTRLVSWFHTGAWLEKEKLEEGLSVEYYPESTLKDRTSAATMLLPDTMLVDSNDQPVTAMSIQDQREAMRALRGQLLHQELYADDGDTEKSKLPYSVLEQSFAVRRLQSSEGAWHGVFMVVPRETVTTLSERNPEDPRVTHELVLGVDAYGNVTRKAAVAYGRASGQAEQQKGWATLTESRFINSPEISPVVDFHRIGLPAEETSYELVDLNPPKAGKGLVVWQALKSAVEGIDANRTFAYDAKPTGEGLKRRMLDRKQQLYSKDDQSGPLGLGQIESLALPYESYQLALTSGLVTDIVSESQTLSGTAFDPALLLSEGHYVQRPDDTGYWTRSGRMVFDEDHFYLPVELVDPFDKHHTVTYDPFSLMVLSTRDALGNIVQAENDYRVMAPKQITDPNLNRAAVEFDALGMVVKAMVMGKEGSTDGDTPEKPGSTLVYDLLRWPTSKLPAFVHTTVREVHRQDTPVQESFSYSDGFGRVVMQKVQAEPERGSSTPRWVGTGRTVFNNKGNPVKQYEPFFSTTSEFEDEAAIVENGVSPIIHYDPLDRVIRTELPNKTESRSVYDTWTQTSLDPNDAVIGTGWYSQRESPAPTDPEPSDPEKRAAWLAVRHADTPTVTHMDALGRAFLVEETNRTYANGGPATEETLRAHTELDVEGNALSVTDPLGIQCVIQIFDVLSRRLSLLSTDAGTRLTVADVAGKPLRAWDSRGHTILSHYDDLQRPTHLRAVEQGGTPKLLQRTVYGESLDPAGSMPTNPVAPSPAQQHNLRGQAYLVFDGAGLLTSDDFDFKGNLKSSTRRLASAYKTVADWSTLPRPDPTGPGAPARDDPAAILTAAEGLLEADDASAPTRFTTLASYDALNRITSRTTPDGSVTKPQYNEAGLLEKVVVSVRGGADTTVVHRIDYNEKGQRILCEQGGASGTPTHTTQYNYDKDTFRLTGITTTRTDGTVLQKLGYTYDPVGNIVALQDDSGWEPLFARKPVAAPGNGKYQYDALYRLISAQGREHPGQQPGPKDDSPANASDLQALDTYSEYYTYDANGNIKRMRHVGSSGWTREYRYAYEVHEEDPEVVASNRLAATSAPSGSDEQWLTSYLHDEHGSMTRMPHLAAIDWDHADRMQHADRGGGGQSYFTYDAAGQRVRKVWEHTGLVDERIYLDGYEIYRRRNGSVHDPVEEERQTLHVMDDQRRVVMVETKKVGTSSTTIWRYQLDNRLGSSTLELDQTGKVITYEEYHPYGTTAFHADTGEVSPKRYRYTGKEKDEETGLYYYGGRYYAAWLGRWTAADPSGTSDGPNLYCYVKNNPITGVDRNGREGEFVDYLKGSADALVKMATGGSSISDIGKAFQGGGGGLLGTLEAIDKANPFAKSRDTVVSAYRAEGGGGLGVLNAIDKLNPVASMRDTAAQAYKEEGGGSLGVANAIDRLNPFAHIRDEGGATISAIQSGDAHAAGEHFTNALVGTAAIASAFATGGASAPATAAKTTAAAERRFATAGAEKAAQAVRASETATGRAAGRPSVKRQLSAPDAKANVTPPAATGAVRFKRWKLGEAIDKPMPSGRAPTWDTVRYRYWRNRFAAAAPNEFTSINMDRMRRGRAPHDELGRPIELHHDIGQRFGGPEINNPRNLREVTASQHEALDRYRHLGGK
jgi:RHS repeat-associated protein